MSGDTVSYRGPLSRQEVCVILPLFLGAFVLGSYLFRVPGASIHPVLMQYS
jgi:hypothetical protein